MRKIILILGLFLLPTISLAYTYGSNVITGGTVTCDSEYDGSTYACTNSTNGNESDWWMTTNTANPHWWKYDLGNGVTKQIQRFYIKIRNDGAGAQLKDFRIRGSQNDTDWTTITTTTASNSATGYQTFDFSNLTAYRYYTIDDTSATYNSQPNFISLFEVQAMECSDCPSGTSTPTSTNSLLMSTTTDLIVGNFFLFWTFLTIFGVVIIVAWLIYKIIRK